MKTFHANQTPDIKMIEVKKRVKSCQAAQINEPFSVGTRNGVAQGRVGDYLLSNEYGLSVVKEADFPLLYEAPKKKLKEEKPPLKDEPKEEKKDEPKEVKPKAAKKSSTEIYQKPKAKKVEKKVTPKATKKVVKKVAEKKKISSKKK